MLFVKKKQELCYDKIISRGKVESQTIYFTDVSYKQKIKNKQNQIFFTPIWLVSGSYNLKIKYKTNYYTKKISGKCGSLSNMNIKHHVSIPM